MHLPLVPLPAFRSLIGAELSAQLDTLLARGDGDVVLFSDPRGRQLALLTVGPGKRFANIAATAAVEIDGLAALCALRAGGEIGDAAPPVDPHHEESLRARENYLEEAEQRLAESAQRLAEREAQVEQREQMLLEKERDFFRRGGASASTP